MSAWWIVFVKEVRENLRDRRAVLSSIVLGAIIGPLLFAGLIAFMVKQETNKAAEELKLPLIGAEYAPMLVDWLQRQDVIIATPPADPYQAVRQREVDLVVEIPAAYVDQWLAGEPAEIHLIHDSSRRDSNTTVMRMQRLITAWGAQIGAQRLRVRGIDPAITRAVAVRGDDLSTPESRGAMILAMLPYMVMLSIFVGGMYLAIDATAGERERQSMEPLLLNPVSSTEIVSGKMLATVAFSLIALALTMVMFRLGTTVLPVAELGIRLNLDTTVLITVFVLMLPVSLLAAGLQTLVAAFSKGFREAQTYMSFLIFIPMLPSLWLALSPVKPEWWMMMIPLLNQSMLVQMLSRDEMPALNWHLMAWGSTAVTAVLVAVLAIYFYRRPAIIGSG